MFEEHSSGGNKGRTVREGTNLKQILGNCA